MKIILAIALILFSLNSYAVKIQFPEEELATESVMPKFDNPVPVMNRNVVTEGKFELAGFLGWTLNDAFVDPVNYGGLLTYHLTEIHALQFYGSMFSAEKNDYPAQIEQETGYDIRDKVAIPKSTYILAYQMTPYYGKLSITKQAVMNMSLYGTLGGGTYQVDEKNSFALSFGIGSKLYFNEDWNIRIDYRFFSFKARDPIDETFGERQQMNSILTIGGGYVF